MELRGLERRGNTGVNQGKGYKAFSGNNIEESCCSPLWMRPRRLLKRNLSPPASWLCPSVSPAVGFSSGPLSSFKKTTGGEEKKIKSVAEISPYG